MNFNDICKNVKLNLSNHSPEILIGIGITGMLSSTIMAVKTTPKVYELIEDEKNRRRLELKSELSKVEIVKMNWKYYMPATISFIVSSACIIGANSVNVKRNTVLATAYKISERALIEYKDKVVEVIGEEKEKEIRDSISKDIIENNPIGRQEVIITGKGDTLCYDVISGRYFKSDIDKMRKIENLINKRIMNDMYCSLNEFYTELGLSETNIGHELGWNINDGLIELDFSTQLSEDEIPCIVVNYSESPRYGYSKLS